MPAAWEVLVAVLAAQAVRPRSERFCLQTAAEGQICMTAGAAEVVVEVATLIIVTVEKAETDHMVVVAAEVMLEMAAMAAHMAVAAEVEPHLLEDTAVLMEVAAGKEQGCRPTA